MGSGGGGKRWVCLQAPPLSRLCYAKLDPRLFGFDLLVKLTLLPQKGSPIRGEGRSPETAHPGRGSGLGLPQYSAANGRRSAAGPAPRPLERRGLVGVGCKAFCSLLLEPSSLGLSKASPSRLPLARSHGPGFAGLLRPTSLGCAAFWVPPGEGSGGGSRWAAWADRNPEDLPSSRPTATTWDATWFPRHLPS